MSLIRYLPTPSDRMGILWSLLSIKDSVVVEYGPAGTTHYSMGLFGSLGIEIQNRLFATHMSEDDVVMGDVSRLEKALLEVDQWYRPKVIFVVASSISAVIGTDLKGVCAYMQKEVTARLITFEQGGFRGDYSFGIREAYRLLTDQMAEASAEKREDVFNIFGASAWAYRSASDVNEIKRLMKEAFDMECHVCLCHEAAAEAVRTCGCAKINLVLRGEALPAAQILEERCGTPYVQGGPYGYEGTLKWLEQISKIINRPIASALLAELKKRCMEVRHYRMRMMTLKEDRPAAVLMGEYVTVTGIGGFLSGLGFRITEQVSTHSLRAFTDTTDTVKCLPVEKDRIDLLRGLHRQFVLADDVAEYLLAGDNTYMRIASPVLRGSMIAVHMPLMGPRGADMILEKAEEYLQTLK